MHIFIKKVDTRTVHSNRAISISTKAQKKTYSMTNLYLVANKLHLLVGNYMNTDLTACKLANLFSISTNPKLVNAIVLFPGIPIIFLG